MQAKETKLQDIIEGTKQYVLPLFQRSYSWDKKEWDVLWEDLCELSEAANPRSHFIGSIVNMPTTSVPEGVTKYMLIDGQQRITTVFIILTLLRDLAKTNNENEFAEEINNTLLVNPYKRGADYFKLLPTQIDREEFQRLIQNNLNGNASQIKKAYYYFDSKLKRTPIEKSLLKKLITNYLSIVSIVLDNDDNPYLVFESLNAKGRPLTQADLIKNYFFMRIHLDQQTEVYSNHWQPMEARLGEKLTEYIRHYLMLDGSIVKQNDVYHSLKERVDQNNAVEYIINLSNTSKYYQRLLDPDFEDDVRISKYLKRLNRIEVTTAYPLILNFYKCKENNTLTSSNFTELLKLLENFLIRRFVCGFPTNQLNKIFPTVIISLKNNFENNYIEGIKSILPTKGYPKNSAFRKNIIEAKLYGGGDRVIKTKLILESVEESFEHREMVPFDDLTIEHIMPQTLSQWWQEYLGNEWEMVYELQLHCIGNLTLTAYNTPLSNADYYTKKEFYHDSHLEINKYFNEVLNWKKEDIERRSLILSDIILNIWPYFGVEDPGGTEVLDFTGTTPRLIIILGQYFTVNSWRDVLENTLNVLADLDPETFEILISEYPNILSKDRSRLRAIRELENGCFVEVNISARSVERFCRQAIELFDLSSDDWKIQIS